MIQHQMRNKYAENSVLTASSAQLLLMLYDGAIRFIKLGIEAIENGNIEQTNNNLIKAQSIIRELQATLNFQYPVSEQLQLLYDFMLQSLINANIKKDAKEAIEILNLMIELKETWQEASQTQVSLKQGVSNG